MKIQNSKTNTTKIRSKVTRPKSSRYGQRKRRYRGKRLGKRVVNSNTEEPQSGSETSVTYSEMTDISVTNSNLDYGTPNVNDSSIETTSLGITLLDDENEQERIDLLATPPLLQQKFDQEQQEDESSIPEMVSIVVDAKENSLSLTSQLACSEAVDLSLIQRTYDSFEMELQKSLTVNPDAVSDISSQEGSLGSGSVSDSSVPSEFTQTCSVSCEESDEENSHPPVDKFQLHIEQMQNLVAYVQKTRRGCGCKKQKDKSGKTSEEELTTL